MSAMNVAKVAAILLGTVGLLSAAPTPSSHVTPATLVERAAKAFSASTRGIIGMQRHFSTVISGGPLHHTEDSDSGLLLNDGAFVKIKYYRIARDGKPFSSGEISKRESQTNQDWAAGKVFFKEPYDRRFLSDYHFSDASCTDCPSGSVALKFTSSIHDAQHGSGMMWIETSTARVLKLSYVPYALPPHATSGSVSETSSEPLHGLWYVTRIHETFGGRAFLISGSGTFNATIDHFRRFEALKDGEAALADGTI